MSKLSTKMKRMLAILLVEVIVATNVITSYASSVDEPFTMTEEEAAGAYEEAVEEPAEEVVAVVEEEPIVEAPVVEAPVEEQPVAESVAEAPATEQPAAVAEAETPVGEAEQPAAEVPTAETPAEEEAAQEAEATQEPVQEVVTEEVNDVETGVEEAECTCTEECTADTYDDACPVCAELANLETAEEKESYLEENCLVVMENLEAEAQATSEPEEEEATAEVVEEDNSVTVTGICKTDGEVIEGTESFEISVEGTVTLAEEAPEIEGYTFADEVTLENGDAITQIKKETTEEETEDEIVKTTSMSYTADTEWTQLTEDITVVFVYTQEEEAVAEETDAVKFIASYVDQEGNAIEGYESETLSFEESMDLTKAPTTIDNYTYIEAKIDDTVVTSINKNAETADEKEIVTYSYTADGSNVEVTEDTTVTFVYEAEKEAVITMECIDEEGNAIEGYEELALPFFEEELVLNDAEKAPYAIMDYAFAEADVDGTVITSVVKESDEETAAVTYSYVTADGETVAIEEDTVITLNYEVEELVVEVRASIVDNFGDPIDEKYTDLDMDELFGEEEVLTLDDVENPPVDKVQIRQSLFKVIKYTYVDATINNEIIASLKREATKETADLDVEEKEYIYSYSTDGETWTKIKEDATVIFEYSDGKKSVYTYEDNSVLVTATLQHANAIPDDAEFVVTPVTPKSSDYNYDAYMEALNNNADAISGSGTSVKNGEAKYTEENTLLYDIAFLAPKVDEEGNVIEGSMVEYQPAEGMVNISIVFKKKQLSNGLEAEKAKDVSIAHLPLEDSVKEQASTTADATDISASDVKVEKIDNASVALDKSGNDQVSFSASTFSIYAATAASEGNTTTDTFISNGGAYTLEYILNNYQIVTLDGDLNLENHCMGAILVNGNQLGYYVGFADDEATAKRVSSYIKGTYAGAVAGRAQTSVTDPSLKPLYIGTVNTAKLMNGQWVINENYNSQMKASAVYVTDNYVDWGELSKALKNQSASLSAGCTDTISEGGALTINAGDCVTITDISRVSSINIIGNMEDAINTIINIPSGGSVYLPHVYINGEYATVAEVSSGTAVAWNIPNASYVEVPSINWVGHIICPEAEVFVTGGNYNGGIICKSMHTKGEGHVYPYNGGTLIPTTSGFTATKTVDGNTPASGETFTFRFDELISGSWKNLATATNSGSKVSFPSINYSEASQVGDHWYIVYEEQKTQEGYSLSTILYVVKDTVTSTTKSNATAFSSTATYYKVIGSENGWIDPSSLINGSTIDTSKLVQISGESAVTFDNSTAKKEISVTKVWNDNNNQDGVRPSSVTVQLKANGSNYGNTVTLDNSNNWTYKWTNLPEKYNGTAINYTVEEVNVPSGYTASISGDAQNGFAITNTHATEKITISGTKVWNDSNNQDGKRPGSITIRLYANGSEVQNKTVTADASGNWNFTFTDLPKYANGQTITYSISEDAVDGYTTQVTGSADAGFTVTNTHETTKININGTKTWNDNGDQDGKRPDSITIRLLANGSEVQNKTVTPDANGNWRFTFKNLPEYVNGNKITYTLTEDAVDGYTTKVNGDVANGFTVVNTHATEKTNISGSKTWNDNSDQDGMRPESITIRLFANGSEIQSKTVTKADGWTWNFTGLDKYVNGTEITYTVKEDAVEGYIASVNGYNVTNTHVPEKTEISGSKTWNDNDDQDGVRPESLTVHLLANGSEVAQKTVTANDNWAWSFTGLDKYANGTEIVYTVTEDAVTDYTTSVNGYDVTNTHETEKINISGSKTWNDANNQDGVRPESITIHLLADGIEVAEKTVTADDNWLWSFEGYDKYKDGKEIVYTITEDTVAGYTTSVNGYDVTNSYTPEKITIEGSKTWNDDNNRDNKRPESIIIKLLANGEEKAAKTVTAEDNWAWSFANLDKYANGSEITYQIVEAEVGGYTTTYHGYDVTNSYTPEETGMTVIKVWDDNNNQDGIRPDAIVVQLYADGEEYGAEVTLNEANSWTHTWTKLPKNEAGSAISYTVEEIGTVTGYTTAATAYEGNTATITNTHTTETVEISGKKTWNDSNNQDGVRPESIIINLHADGEKVASKTVKEADGWAWSFTDQPKYKDGVAIVYTITEEVVEGYTTSVNGYNVTNTHIPEKTEVNGSKTWADNNDQDGMRPESITVNLLADGKQVDSVTVTAEDNWSWTFTNLDKYKAGEEIVYTVTEEAVEGYTAAVNGYDITNTHETEKTSVSGSKTWNDADNQDGKRPESITINLHADGEKVASQTVTAQTGWTWSFADLDKYKAGKEIVYTITEDEVAEYTTSVNGYDVTNTHIVEKVDINGTKIWNDNNNQDGVRPTTVVIKLLANGKEIQTVNVTAADIDENGNWAWSFDNLPKYENGVEIEYTVTEAAVEGYTPSVSGDVTNGFTITNSHTPGETEISVKKIWNDANDQDGVRPGSIQVQLYAEVDGSKEAYGDAVALSESNSWSASWNNLPEFEAGKEIGYTVEEVADTIPEGYTSEYKLDADGKLVTITNTHEIEKTSISGKKTWADNNNQDGIRPASITIHLLADGELKESKTVTADNNWSWTFTDLDKYANGKEIVYSITEEAVDGYTTEVSGYDVTNTHKTEKTEVSGSKTWIDNDNQDGLRPAQITIHLLADGIKVDSKVVKEADGWAWSFTELDKYKDGKEISYTITEDKVEEYSTEVNGNDVVNSHTPGKTTYSVEKIWDDADNQDGKRAASITVQLLANGEAVEGSEVELNEGNSWKHTWTELDEKKNGQLIDYSVAEITATEGYTVSYTETDNGTIITNTHEVEKTSVSGSKTWVDNDDQDGMRPESITITLLGNGSVAATKEVTADSNWTWSFTDLPKYANGSEITYTITESEVAGYTTEINGFDVTNTHVTEKTEVNGSKLWNDANNQDGKRPESVTINLLADGTKVASQTISADAEGNWSYKFEDLDKYANGKEIVYTVTEEEIKTADYSVSIDGFTITNNYTPDETAHTVKKVWDDADNQDGIRPETVQVQLLADGKDQGSPVTLSASNGWSYKWEGLTKYRDGGVEINYTAVEVGEVSGYTIGTPATANGETTITNTHTTETVDVSGSKTWNDADNQDGKRPVSITINLLADGVKAASKTVTEADGWTWSFTGLDKYKAGKEIVYTIEEEAVENYETTITGNAKDGFTVTNTYETETVDISGSKMWDDADNQDGKRPVSITVNLVADGEATGKSVTVTEADGWKWSFTGLDKYKAGKEITYTVTEDTVTDYSTDIDGYVITNSYTPGKTNHTVTKVWDDADNQDGKRPSSIQVQLLADGKAQGEPVTLSASNSWTYTWTDLDLMSAGEKIRYTVEEVSAPSGYTLTSNVTDNTTDTTTITNSYETEKTSVSGKKTWSDNNDQDGVRPESITINLFADGVKAASKTVTEADGWAWSFTGLDKYKAGSEIVYTITEDVVAGYESVVNGFDVTNTHKIEKTEVSGIKTWNDADNQDGVRPESITVNLLANGEKAASKVVAEADGWAWSFTDLDKYANGSEITYTITEDKITTADYQAKVDGYNITNSYTPGKTSLSVTKVWVDGEDQDGIRPDSVTVQLYADGKPVDGATVELNAANGWMDSFDDLDEKKDGQIIEYTAKEVGEISGYVVSYENTSTATTITNTHTPDEINVSGIKKWEDNDNQDGKRPESITVNLLANGKVAATQVVAPDADGNWTYTFTGFPKKEGGVDIVYTVSEEAVEGYTATVNGTNITNTHEVEKTSVSGSKTWVGDEENLDARPESITINLFADNAKIDSKTVTEADGWAWSFTDLDKYKDGKEIVYTITEDYVNGYSTDVRGSDVINTYTPGYTSMEVTKIWEDNDNQDGKRPETIVVQLYEKYIDWGLIEVSGPKGDPITLSADNNWTAKWENLPVKKQSSDEVQYFVKEIGTIAGYATEIINGTDIKITNTYETETTKVNGKKVWDDNDDQDGVRPESITVRLYDGETEVAAKTVTAADDWTWSFTDLPKYKNGGTLIVYTVKEDVVIGYESVITGDAIDGFTVTNSHEAEKTEYQVEKVWDDADDQDGIRPETITVQLYADGEAVEGKTAVLSTENAWKATFEDLDKYADGELIVYTAQETEVPEGYEKSEESTAAKTTITNTHKTETTEVSGSKTWADADDQDGVRPEKITIRLYADGTQVGVKEVTAKDGWKWSFTDLPKNEAGKEITYTITEDTVEGYSTEVNGYHVVNTHEVEKTELSGSKVWDDADDQDGERPESITVNLHANGEKAASKVVTEADNWTWSFTDLDKFEAGEEIVYTVSEDAVPKYTTVIEGTTITNSYTPGKTSLSVSKIWTDGNDQDGIRPESITVDLYADGKKVEGRSVELSEGNGWAYTWTELDEKKDGQKIIYTAVEADEVSGYTTAYNNETTGTTIITNTHETEEIDITGTKTWADNDDQDGKRPESITIRLLADGSEVKNATVTPDEAGSWTWSFADLPKYRDGGVEIVYTITEDAVAGYETEVDGYNVTNTHEPEKVSVSGSKTWSDNNDAESARPESITIRLYADSVEVDSITVVPDEAGSWTWSFTDLDKYANGQEINYTVSEDKVIDYQSAVDGYNVNNTYNPGTTQISVSKNWVDNNDQDGIRPSSITVKLMEKTTFFDRERDEVTLDETNNWSYTWTNLPDEKKSEKVQYYVKEVKVDGYETEINNGTSNITITNTHVTETTEVKGSKSWNDNNNQDGRRPSQIVIRLLADGEEVANKTVTEAEDWKWSFTELPKYRDGGVEIVYTITEDAIEEYTTEITGNAADGFTVTNTDEIDKTEYRVEKVWDDADDQDGIRPETITVQLYADGEAVEGKTAVLSTENAWKATFEDLDKYADGKLIVYTAQETEVPAGYTMTADHATEDLTVITNSHETEVVSVAGGKTWVDADNQDGVRPASITINLLADGVKVAERTVTAADNWAWSFTDLPKNEAGKEIGYTITENEVAEYTAEVDGYNVTNNHTPETVEVTGTKTWDDADNQDGKRPAEITITLNADGEPAKQVTVTEDDNWTWTFTDLPKYKDGGQEIVYTVSEAAVAEYTTTYDGYNVTNSYTPGETGVTVTKAWDDNNDQDGIRPEAIQVQLAADGAAYGDPVTLNADNNWTYTWTELPEMKQGQKITYTVEEMMESDSGYTSVTTGDAANGYTITNTHTPETVEVEGAKTWIDADNQDGKRPASITINLLADGELKESKNVTAADGWKWSFTDLPKYRDSGVEIVYTITENEIADYVTEVNDYDVVNTHTPETVEVSGKKTWNDNENAEGVRPEEIIINLLADGQLVESKTVTEADGWAWSFTNLDKYKDGVEIVYTITEEEVLDYSTTVEGYDVTNDYTPEETKITVTKVWDDNDDQDGIRPDSIKVQLYEGVFARGEAVELNAENNWTYSWENLPAKKFGLTVEYTVKELDKIPGYTTEVVDGTSTTITNTHVPEVVEVEGSKTWDDADNQDGKRPESITINLYADGVLKESKTVTEAEGWEWSFTDLPKNKNVNGEVSEIVYTIEEVAVEGYESVTEEGSYDITNVHEPEVIDIKGTKTWDDADNQDGIRPASITVRLYANGTEIDSRTVTAANGWKWKFTDLPKYSEGVKITYTITEDVVANYSTTYDGYNVTNSYTPEKTSRTVVKVWDDKGDRDNLRPGSIVVQLYADGSAYGEPVILSKANSWSYTWSDLDLKKNGVEIVYTVVEISKVAGYTTTYSENTFTITNKHTPKDPTPTPNVPTPTPTPDNPVPTPTPGNDPTPTPTPDEEVLGAKRVEDGMVLGARRGSDYAVLGKRRRPATGDSLEIFVWIMALAASMGGVVTSLIMMSSNKKRRK